MEKIIISLIMLITIPAISFAQDKEIKNRKKIRAERLEEKIEETRSLVENQEFLFTPTHAIPMGGGSIQLDFSFDVELKNDTVTSYLPFYGVAYHVDYGGRNSAFDFILPVENIQIKKVKNGYQIIFDVVNRQDHISFIFNISEPGYATLNIISTNRQVMSYYGSIKAP